MHEGSVDDSRNSVPTQHLASQPLPSGPAPQSVPVHKGLLIGAMALVVLLLLSVVGLVLALVASQGEVVVAKAAASAALERAEAPAPTSPDATATPSPEPEPEEETENVYGLGETFTVGAVTLTVHSVEPVDIVETTEGEPIVADAGGQLFMMKSTYSNAKKQADLSCGSADLYLQMVDSEEREISQVFESYRIPGNPGCNEQLLQDTPREWSLVFQGLAGATPLGMIVDETITYPESAVVRFQ